MKTRKLSSIVKMLILVMGVTMFVSSCGDKTTGKHNGHEWVDLGLPSGTKWATMNVGASSPSDYGDYFAWGETSPKSSYYWENLKYYLANSNKFTKYVTYRKRGTVDGNEVLELSDDAAYVNWGSGWRMPSREQQEELLLECKWIWTSQGGHHGYEVVGPNGNSIFLPAAGWCESNPFVVDMHGCYWSRSLNTSRCYNAYSFYLDSSGVDKSDRKRYLGQSVRAVLGIALAQ